MRGAGIVIGVLLALVALVALWATGVVDPPESVSRALAARSAIYPNSVRDAEIERIPCPPLPRLRLYVVCTGACEDTWMIVGVRGLWPENLANPGRLPPQPEKEYRARIAAAVARERRSLDRDGAREMVACYLRIGGKNPELVLRPLDRVALEAAREDDDAMRRLAESLGAEDVASRIEVEEAGGGFLARVLYWDTALPDRPVIEMTFGLERNGVLRSLDVTESIRDGSGSGSTSDIPPS